MRKVALALAVVGGLAASTGASQAQILGPWGARAAWMVGGWGLGRLYENYAYGRPLPRFHRGYDYDGPPPWAYRGPPRGYYGPPRYAWYGY